jgi:DNA-binding protein Fis
LSGNRGFWRQQTLEGVGLRTLPLQIKLELRGAFMGYKFKDATRKAGTFNYRAIKVMLVKKSATAAEDETSVVLTAENDWETLSFINDNMDAIAANLVRVKQMNQECLMHVEETAQLFEKNLQPLFSLISATSTDHVMDKLSVSLKKALLLMAMERYCCDSDSICRALGISRGKLEKELKRCGLPQQERKAA